MFGLYQSALDCLGSKQAFALSMLVYSQGSTPQKAGAKALFSATGGVQGTLGGGCLEAEAQQRALRSLDTEETLLFDLRLDDIDGWDDGLVCGGRVRILSIPRIDANVSAYKAAVAAEAQGKPGVLVTVLDHESMATGTAAWIDECDFHKGYLDLDEGTLKNVLQRERAITMESTQGSCFLEPLCLPPRLLIAGGGHIGKAVAHYAAGVGFSVTVVDDRPAFANGQHIPEAHEVICGDIVKTVGDWPIDAGTYVVIVTRGHQHDGKVLAACMGSDARYIGMIGSQRKSLILRQRVIEEGIATPAQMEEVISPIGLDIGARTVEEIALSIVAHLVAVRRRGDWSGPALSQGHGKV